MWQLLPMTWYLMLPGAQWNEDMETCRSFLMLNKRLKCMLLICTVCWKLGAVDILPFRNTFSDAKAVFLLVNSFQSLGCSQNFSYVWDELNQAGQGEVTDSTEQIAVLTAFKYRKATGELRVRVVDDPSHDKDPSAEMLSYFKEVVRSGLVSFIFPRTWTIAFYVALFLQFVCKVYKWILWWCSAHSLVSFQPPLRVSYCVSHTNEPVFPELLVAWPYQLS